MKMHKYYLLIGGLLLNLTLMAQQIPSGLQNAVAAAVANSKSVISSKSGVELSKMEYQTAKEARLPEIAASGQFMYLPIEPQLNLKFQEQNNTEAGSDTPGFSIPKTVVLGSVNASLPIFTGFKIKNNLVLSSQKVEAQEISLEMQKEISALQAIQLYTSLYKVQETINVLTQNLKQSETRIKDFSNFVENGLLPENDLLQAKLQYSNIELSKDEAENQLANLNFRLNKLTGTDLAKVWSVDDLGLGSTLLVLENSEFSGRKDLALLRKSNEMAKTGIELSRSNYFPSIALTAGYLGANLGSFASISNPLSVGVGLKYNISSLYKNQTEMKVAHLKLQEAQHQLIEANDHAAIEVNEAQNQYKLALKKVKVYELAVTQSKENLRIVTNKYNNGLEDTDHLLEADIQHLQAEINEKNAKADQLMSWFNVSYTTGNLLEYFNIK